MAVVVNSLPSCVQCGATKRLMGKLGIEFEEVLLTNAPEKLAEFKEAGLVAAPIVEANGEVWSGYNPDKIRELVD